MRPSWTSARDLDSYAQRLDLSAIAPGAQELGALGLDLTRLYDADAATFAFTFEALADLEAAAATSDVWLMSGSFASSGDFAFYYDVAGSTEWMQLKGSPVGVVFGQSGFVWSQGDIVTLVAWRDRRRMAMGAYGLINGEVRRFVATVGGSPGGSGTLLPNPSELWICSNLGATPLTAVQPLSFAVAYQHLQVGPEVVGIGVGNSIMGNIASDSTEVRAGLFSFCSLAPGKRVFNAAIGGSTIAQLRTTIWANIPARWKTSGAVRWVALEAAINDAFQDRTSAQMIADAQALIDQVAADMPWVRIYWLEGTPCKSFLGAPEWAEYDTFRQAVLGGALAGCVVVSGYFDPMCTSPGSGILAGGSIGYPGGLHQRPAGSRIMAAVFDSARAAYGDP